MKIRFEQGVELEIEDGVAVKVSPDGKSARVMASVDSKLGDLKIVILPQPKPQSAPNTPPAPSPVPAFPWMAPVIEVPLPPVRFVAGVAGIFDTLLSTN
jgi:hypothetical protein